METKSRIVKLTTSQVKCFKTCRRRYFLEYVENLKPIETPKPLEIGTLYHRGLELLMTGRQYLDVECDLIDLHRANAEAKGIDYDPLNAYVALEMVRAWDRESGWRDWGIVSVEKQFEVTTGYAKRLIGKIDGLVIRPETGKPYLMEHKTTSQWGETYLDQLSFDEQATNYLYAYRRMLEDGVIDGAAVEGIFYDIIEKPKNMKPYTATPMDKRKYTLAGGLKAGQHEHDETPEDFRLRVRAWYAEAPRIHTAYVYRTQADIDDHIRDFNLVLKDISAAEREETYYRNPEACKILPCPYRSKCLDNVPDTDCLFTRKTSQHEELEK